MSQLSGRMSGTGFEAVPEWAPGASRRGTQRAASAIHWRQQYRRRLLATDVLLVLAAVTIPVLVAAAGLPGTVGAGTRVAQWTGSIAGLEGGLARTAGLALLVAVSWLLMLHLFQTRAAGRIAIGVYEYKSVVDATAALAGWVAVLAVLGTDTGLRGFLIIALPFGLLALLVGRWSWRRWLQAQRRLGHALSDVVVYGQAKDAPYVVRQIGKKSGAAYRVVGVVLDGAPDADAENLIRATSPGLPLMHGGAGIEQEVSRLGADAVVVAGALQGGNRAIQDLGWRLERTRTEVILVSSLTNVAGPRIRMRPVEGLPLMHVELPTFTGWRHVLKRAMDIAVSSVALLVLVPLFLVIALLISRDSKGGVFFKQERTGRRGQPFTMYKFRSMVATAEQDLQDLKDLNEGAGPLFKLKQDPRITRVGTWLRKFSLDELPQFYNVLRGDMAVVGPRPPLPSEVAAYEGHTHRRLYIKPGVTGLWQVNGRSDLDWEESVRLDLYYVENWSVTGDLMIMWRTFKVMINPSGAY
ncbi:sugar transferase [Arthrobacter sp. JSM 101049]|uniref:sugar transferase n=1 Tax=Arthrobacter sp. JSM 101049 TaxID=929097 RepID=UPI0035652A67